MGDMLSKWQRIKKKDPCLIVNALGITQNYVSIALSCIQAQQQMQSTKALREGDEGILPTEFQKVIWVSTFNSKEN